MHHILEAVGARRARLADEMDESEPYQLHPIGVVRSTLRAAADAPNQAFEGAPEAVLEIDSALADALHRIEPGDELILLTWLHLADRRVLQTHPAGDKRIPLTGVFRTRSPDRPNPIGVHRVIVTAFEGPTRLRVGALEAIDGTSIVGKLIVCALWTEICMAFQALDELRDGYDVYPVVDAIGGTSVEAHRAGLERVVQAGGKPVSWVSLGVELQRDWARGETVDDVVEIVLTERLLKA